MYLQPATDRQIKEHTDRHTGRHTYSKMLSFEAQCLVLQLLMLIAESENTELHFWHQNNRASRKHNLIQKYQENCLRIMVLFRPLYLFIFSFCNFLRGGGGFSNGSSL